MPDVGLKVAFSFTLALPALPSNALVLPVGAIFTFNVFFFFDFFFTVLTPLPLIASLPAPGTVTLRVAVPLAALTFAAPSFSFGFVTFSFATWVAVPPCGVVAVRV